MADRVDANGVGEADEHAIDNDEKDSIDYLDWLESLSSPDAPVILEWMPGRC